MSVIIKSPFSWDAFFMKHAYLAASKSKDPRTKIGAVLVKDNVVVSEGFNGFARGVKDYEKRYLDRETKYLFTIHGELNAILNAARMGRSTLDSVMYTQAYPCHECAKDIINAGVIKVYIHKGWPKWKDSKWKKSAKLSSEMFREAGVEVFSINDVLKTSGLFCGAEIEV